MTPPRAMEFRILGPLEVSTGGRALPLPGTKARALLAILLLHANEVVSTDRLIDELWGEDAPQTAANALYVYVSELRKSLADGGREGSNEILVTRKPGYQLRVDPDELDLHRFARLLRDGRAALTANDPATAARLLREALSLWRGPPLADVASQLTNQRELVGLEEERLLATEDRIEAELALGLHARLVSELEGLVAEHPVRERLRKLLMLALYRSGRQVEALESYREARTRLRDELGLEPSPGLRELQQAILNQDPALGRLAREPGAESPTPTLTPNNLPTPPTPLIGRRRELMEASALLRRKDVRLLTLTGAPGSGKTRLALQLAADLLEQFSDGVFFVELAALRDAHLVPSEIARTLGVAEQGAEAIGETLKTNLAGKHLLLVIDNFEHVLAAASLLSELLAEAPGLRLLVTSRASLQISGEHGYPVPPLELPDLDELPAVAVLAAFDAVELFLARAQAVDPKFRLTETNARVIAEITVRLDGLPLALELAAARVRLLSPQTLLTRLERPLELLRQGARDLPARHRTLRATIDWSHDLLAEAEQILFRRLSVFSGGFTLEAAESVCDPPGPDPLEALDSLLDKGLLVRRQKHGQVRYLMLTTIAGYAGERLEASGEAESVRRRHAEFFLTLAEQARAELDGAQQTIWLERLDADLANLRAALAWSRTAEEHGLELRLAAALSRFWTLRGYVIEARRSLEGALAASTEKTGLRARALWHASYLAMVQAEYERARDLASESLSLCRELGDRQGTAYSLASAASPASALGDDKEATSLLEESAALFRELGDPLGLAISLGNLGSIASARGDYERAIVLSRESVALSRELADRGRLVQSLFNLGVAYFQAGKQSDAGENFAESLRLSQELQFHQGTMYCLVGLAAVASARGEATQAALFLGAAQALHEDLAASLEPAERLMYEHTVGSTLTQLGDERFETLVAQGQSMELDEAIAEAAKTAEKLRGSSGAEEAVGARAPEPSAAN